MKKDIHKTKVIFRKFKEGDIIALFPELPGNGNLNSCDSYMHVGQHSSANVLLIDITKLATPEEYKSLYDELESIGYNLQIMKRYTFHMFQKRNRINE